MKLKIPEGTYIELVRRVFATLLPTITMALSFIAVSTLVVLQTHDTFLRDLAVFGSAAALARIGVLLVLRKKANDETLDVIEARRLEQYFAASYLVFAGVFGVFSARAFWVAGSDTRILVIGLLFGYAAGVAAGISYRPQISISAIVTAVVPTICVAAFTSNLTYWAVAALLAIFMLGGIESMISRYRVASSGITMRRHYSAQARSDALTGLANRLALSEAFDRIVDEGGTGTTAVHYLDLDRFKPVNDLYGHPTGDLLLQAVGARLSGLVRKSDFAARIGGDEFVVIQANISHPGEADLLARRIVRTLGQPYSIEGHDITIGTSVGYALTSQGHSDLEQLIASADEALLRAKAHGGGGIVSHQPSTIVSLRRAG